MHVAKKSLKIIILAAGLIISVANSFSQKTGIFDGHTDVGKILHPGSTTYDASSDSYQLSGSGTNIWFTHDDFQYAWKKIKGDFILQARGKLIGKGVEAHRKFGWMIRKNLDSTSAMIAATIHGSGLTSLQYRKVAKTNVEEKQLTISLPDVIQLERRGNIYIMSVAHKGEIFTQDSIQLDLGDNVYAGLFVCSHNNTVKEKAGFYNVRIVIPAWPTLVPYKDYLGSQMEVMDVETGRSKIIYQSPRSFQAPNYMPGGKSLLYNSDGLIYLHISGVV